MKYEKIWRMYRLPGSMKVWHIDSGPNTAIVNVLGFQIAAQAKSVDIGGNNHPHTWVEFDAEETHLFIINHIAIFAVNMHPERCGTVAAQTESEATK
jgi:hypothetical protein